MGKLCLIWSAFLLPFAVSKPVPNGNDWGSMLKDLDATVDAGHSDTPHAPPVHHAVSAHKHQHEHNLFGEMAEGTKLKNKHFRLSARPLAVEELPEPERRKTFKEGAAAFDDVVMDQMVSNIMSPHATMNHVEGEMLMAKSLADMGANPGMNVGATEQNLINMFDMMVDNVEVPKPNPPSAPTTQSLIQGISEQAQKREQQQTKRLMPRGSKQADRAIATNTASINTMPPPVAADTQAHHMGSDMGKEKCGDKNAIHEKSSTKAARETAVDDRELGNMKAKVSSGIADVAELSKDSMNLKTQWEIAEERAQELKALYDSSKRNIDDMNKPKDAAPPKVPEPVPVSKPPVKEESFVVPEEPMDVMFPPPSADFSTSLSKRLEPGTTHLPVQSASGIVLSKPVKISMGQGNEESRIVVGFLPAENGKGGEVIVSDPIGLEHLKGAVVSQQHESVERNTVKELVEQRLHDPPGPAEPANQNKRFTTIPKLSEGELTGVSDDLVMKSTPEPPPPCPMCEPNKPCAACPTPLPPKPTPSSTGTPMATPSIPTPTASPSPSPSPVDPGPFFIMTVKVNNWDSFEMPLGYDLNITGSKIKSMVEQFSGLLPEDIKVSQGKRGELKNNMNLLQWGYNPDAPVHVKVICPRLPPPAPEVPPALPEPASPPIVMPKAITKLDECVAQSSFGAHIPAELSYDQGTTIYMKEIPPKPHWAERFAVIINWDTDPLRDTLPINVSYHYVFPRRTILVKQASYVIKDQWNVVPEQGGWAVGEIKAKHGTNESAKVGLFYVQNTDCSFPDGGIQDPYLRPRLPKINPWPTYQFNLKECMASARAPNVAPDPAQAGQLIKVTGIPGQTEEVMCAYPSMKGYMLLDMLGDKSGIAKYAIRAELSTDKKKSWRPIENFVTLEEMGLTEITGFSYVRLSKIEAVLAEQMPNMDPPEVPEVQMPVEVGIIGKNFSAVQLSPNTGVLDWESGATKTGDQIAAETIAKRKLLAKK